jgi:RimJ/RimL family protein N-acetyltransferase
VRLAFNDPGVRDLVKRLAGVRPLPDDPCIGVVRDDGSPAGGFIFTGYLGASIQTHMAGEGRWLSAELLAVVANYMFRQLGVRKAVATVAASNHRALAIDFKLGFRIAALLDDVLPDGAMFILELTAERCKWLSVPLRTVTPGVRPDGR